MSLVSASQQDEQCQVFKEVMNMLPEAIVVLKNGRILCMSPEAMQLFGFTGSSDYQNKTYSNFFEDIHAYKRFRNFFQDGFQDNRNTELQTPLKKANGDFFLARISGKPLNQELADMLLTIKDVTEEEEVQAEMWARLGRAHSELNWLRHSYYNVLDAVNMGIVILRPDGTILEVNKYITRKLGDDWRGKKCFVMCDPAWSDKDRGICSFCRIKDVVASGRPDSAMIQDKTGNHWLFTWAPIKDDSGKITAIIKTITNINREVFLKKELTFQEEFLTAIIEHIPVGLLIINEQGEIEYINDSLARRWGHETDSLPGKNLQELDIYNQQFLLQIITNAMTNGKRLDNIEYQYEKTDKTNWTVTCSFIPLTLPDNRKMGLLVETDITAQTAQREKAEQKAAKLDQELLNLEKTVIEQKKLAAIGQLAAGITHELNTPTTYIRGNLQTFAKYGATLNSYLQKLKTVDRENSRKNIINRMESLISSMEDISVSALQGTTRIMDIVSSMRGFVRDNRSEEEQINLFQSMTDALVLTYNRLKHIGQATINEWRFTPAETQKFIDFHTIIIKNGNSQRLCQLFVILLNNSIDAWLESSPAGQGKKSPLAINIRVSSQKKNILCTVCDNSGGMAKNIEKKVFKPFFTTKKGGRGTGLGMSICRQIVREHHGAITLENHPGSGVCWNISLRNRD